VLARKRAKNWKYIGRKCRNIFKDQASRELIQIKEELLTNEEKVVRDKYDLKSEISVSGLSARTTKYKCLPKMKQETVPLDEVSCYIERERQH
jgi:hypothetical protein